MKKTNVTRDPIEPINAQASSPKDTIILSTEHLKKNPRVGKVDLSELRFFAYEKQKAHN